MKNNKNINYSIVRFLGGLGNQMFQYAFMHMLKMKNVNVRADLHNYTTCKMHNGYELDRVFNINIERATIFEILKLSPLDIFPLYISQGLKKIFPKSKTVIKEVDFDNFLTNQAPLCHNNYYDGYWQKESYFREYKMELLDLFVFDDNMSSENLLVKNEIISENSISLHIRRGDYLNHPLYQNICELDYYTRAISYIRKRIKDPFFFIFSNDSDWCNKNISPLLVNEKMLIVDFNKDENSFRDMQLMSLCKHNIIANSSFSWWAAWLNKNQNKIIISPSKWVNRPDSDSIIPKEWIKL